MKPPSPLLGFNNNVRHKGRVFHIQTEDSGVRHPHIITHLFADGGRILKTTKTSYAEFIDAPNMGEVVRQMMQDQHKAMFMALRDGQYDHLVDELPTRGGAAKSASTASLPAASSGAGTNAATAGSGPRSVREPPVGPPPIPLVNPLAMTQPMAAVPAVIQARATTPLAGHPVTTPPMTAPSAVAPPVAPVAPPVAAPAVVTAPLATPTLVTPSVTAPSKVLVPAAPVMVPAPPPVAATLPAGAPPVPSAPVVPPPLPPLPPVTSFPSVPPAPTAQAHAQAHVTRPTPPRGASARPRLDIDPAAIHRAPEPHSPAQGGTLASVVEASVEGPGIDLDTLERAAAEAETPLFQQIRDLPPPPSSVLAARPPAASPGGYSSVSAPPAPPTAASPSSQRGGRYAPSRPSSIFAAVRPQEGASIFGEDLISEKSLDEVILSYLAEDLDSPSEKK